MKQILMVSKNKKAAVYSFYQHINEFSNYIVDYSKIGLWYYIGDIRVIFVDESDPYCCRGLYANTIFLSNEFSYKKDRDFIQSALIPATYTTKGNIYIAGESEGLRR